MTFTKVIAAVLLLGMSTAASASNYGQQGAKQAQASVVLASAQNPYAVITIPQKLIDSLQLDFGLTKAQAAGITGNLAHESGNFTMLKEINGGCYGYSQWCGVRKTAFRSFAENAGGQTTFEANYGFLRKELKSEYGNMLKRIRATNTVDAAAKIFMKEFLRPDAKTANLSRRISFGRQFLQENFSGSGCYSHPRLLTTNRPAPCPGDTL
jgi:hypothetical protein